jgi:hypothetical protein
MERLLEVVVRLIVALVPLAVLYLQKKDRKQRAIFPALRKKS